MPTAKTKTKAPRLEVSEDATLADMTEAVHEYLEALYGDESIEDLRRRVQGLQRDLRGVEEDLSTAQAGLEDALQRDLGEIDAETAKDPEAAVATKNYDRERERLARQVIKRQRLRKMLAEAKAALGFRVAAEQSARAQELHGELEPLRAELLEKQQRVDVLAGLRAEAATAARENMPSKHDIARIVEVQKPDLSALRQYLTT